MDIKTPSDFLLYGCDDVEHGAEWSAGFYNKNKGVRLPYSRLKNGAMCYHFTSMTGVWELVDHLRYVKEWHGVHKKSNSSNQENCGEWVITSNLADCIDKMMNTPQMFCNFNMDDDRLLEEDSSGNSISFDVTGEYLDVGRYLSNDPECFGNTRFGKQNPKFCTINISISHAWFIHKGIIDLRNSCICQLVDFLENNNVRCRIKAIEVTECGLIGVIVKDYTDPLNMNNVAVVNSPDFLRRIVFLLDEFSPTWEKGYGTAGVSCWHMVVDPDATFTISCSSIDSNNKNAIVKDYKQAMDCLKDGTIMNKARENENYVYSI